MLFLHFTGNPAQLEGVYPILLHLLHRKSSFAEIVVLKIQPGFRYCSGFPNSPNFANWISSSPAAFELDIQFLSIVYDWISVLHSAIS